MADVQALSAQELAVDRVMFEAGFDATNEQVLRLLATIDERDRIIEQQRRALQAVRDECERVRGLRLLRHSFIDRIEAALDSVVDGGK